MHKGGLVHKLRAPLAAKAGSSSPGPRRAGRRLPRCSGAKPRFFGGVARVALYTAAGLIALGNGIVQPALPAYVSRRAGKTEQGLALGTLQSASALGRVIGPALGGVLYSTFSTTAPYTFGAVGLFLAAILAAARLPD